jgi:hypothetical protein
MTIIGLIVVPNNKQEGDDRAGRSTMLALSGRYRGFDKLTTNGLTEQYVAW